MANTSENKIYRAMTIDEYVTTIIEQIQVAKDNAEVEEVIQVSITNMTEKKKNGFIVQRCLNKLQIALEEIPPLTCSSEQWSCYRFALICIRTASVKQVTADQKKIL
jgi:5-methylcytosine-specific restriction endonuclease McrBC regulatory subunit McrC